MRTDPFPRGRLYALSWKPHATEEVIGEAFRALAALQVIYRPATAGITRRMAPLAPRDALPLGLVPVIEKGLETFFG